VDANEDRLIARLFKDTLTVVMPAMIASTIGNVIDGIITGSFLGSARARNANSVQ